MDITKIEGYSETLTPEQKLELISKYNLPALDYTGWIKKDAFDRTASELAEAKKSLKAKMTEDEQKEAERAAAETAIKTELETLRKDKAVSENKARFLGLGYEAKLAEETAKALADGNIDKVFANQAIHLETVTKVAKASALANDPAPAAGAGTQAIDYSKEIAAAQANSDFGLAAMLMRQQQEITNKK